MKDVEVNKYERGGAKKPFAQMAYTSEEIMNPPIPMLITQPMESLQSNEVVQVGQIVTFILVNVTFGVILKFRSKNCVGGTPDWFRLQLCSHHQRLFKRGIQPP